ncbi:CRISPR system precrRNA processing endoribonuclease RAMP protein Cas6 [Trichocoleus sp. FACHB-90]|uniref:CRISPR system precrRNA processing endoribonuclease RAMP protein Cas6 n=1 Tax=Cyanophyceae TaxID=3028117 RepID=UPI0016895EB0|nr:CRISPR system precrRNA processing endoribonuclease RAMP protein Cas6 [Trichocoleus sp. FACHB-90]MBD1930121.1 CRISPR system precrRNA processing endoribonuclease RAMP protein Cas6 [Trichocoleus sp. FACHB-90]
MTSTNESDAKIAGLSVVLRSTTRVRSMPLGDWSREGELTPVWIPQCREQGITKAIAVLPQAKFYPRLVQQLVEQISQSSAVEWQGKSYDLAGVEVDTHDLHVLRIPIFLGQPLPANLGRAIHALCFRWLGLADSALAEQLYQQNHLPFALSIQPSSSRQPMYLRIGLLQKELLSPMLWGLSQDLGREITLSDRSCRLGRWVERLHTSSFEALSQVSPLNTIELLFLSPTSFKQGQRIQPFPLPELVFGNLLRRWNAFVPVELQFLNLEWQGLTCAYELGTQVLHLKGGAEIGTTGWVRYEFPNPQQAKVATILAHFANFAGVGRKTGMGMGQVRIR